jgi:GDSL-like lipase/acylhydrolase family protein
MLLTFRNKKNWFYRCSTAAEIFRATLCLMSCILLLDPVSAQTIDSSAYKQYVFIKRDLNKIENDSSSLAFFYEKIYQLEQKKITRINIAHIGDSHIQADLLSGSVRQKMQLKFGNAGRGFIFPYRVAKSNEPQSYKSITNVTWEAKRNVFYDKPLPVGVGGFTIETSDSLAEINLLVKDQPKLDYAFTKFTLFHDKGLGNFDITVCDDLNCEVGKISSLSKSTNPFVSELKFNKPIRQIYLRNKISDTTNQRSTRIYGMLVENDSAGVLYNMIGVNGAEYRHYVMSKYFIQQLSYLSSDLIILSLGTNEAFSAGFDKDVFARSVDSLIVSIRASNPNASVLISTPADSYRKSRKGRVKNPDMKLAKETLITYCLQHNIAYWDLYEIMGGYGSMGKWYAMKLSAKDRVHFSGKGYQIQGDLLYNALIQGYEKYKAKK